MNKWELARRDLLKSLGLGIGCLPLLRASELPKISCREQSTGGRSTAAGDVARDLAPWHEPAQEIPQVSTNKRPFG